MTKSSVCVDNAIPFLLLLLLSITPFTQNSLVFASTLSHRIATRPDPLRKFKHYARDYDLSDKHYWASTAFTGIPGYAVAGVWLISGVGFAVFVVVKNLNGTTSPVVDPPNSSNLIMFFLILLFTVFAISASSVIIAANEKSLQRAEKLEDTLFGAGDDASLTIGKVRTTLLRMQTSLLPYDSKTCTILDMIGHRLRKGSLSIHGLVGSTRKSCDQVIHTFYMVNLVVVSVNLVLLVAGLVLITLHYRPGIIVLIFSCWILTTFSWILTGLDFFFYTFIGDTCSTLENYIEDPRNNSLTAILPCPKSTDSDITLAQINHSVHDFIAEINSKVREVLASVEGNEHQPIPEICDPFSAAPHFSYSPQICRNDSIQVRDLPNVLSRFICYEDNSTENCQADGRFLPEAVYPVSLAYCRSIQDFIDIYPDMSGLMKCSAVKRAFSDIVQRQCKPIRRTTKVLWSSMLVFSIVMVVVVLLWSDRAIRDRRRCSGQGKVLNHNFHRQEHGSS
ncbi:hypothetical protein Salat_2459300 [Sesamum alatum]|uniref:Uncharacterized protein n=1 Tax=Sesamum alatum TaxID=300844 RepID=A0AAE1XRR6_9LAMI|nr:hypothetical protein Salat_2459300 [Sesamum alatum]